MWPWWFLSSHQKTLDWIVSTFSDLKFVFTLFTGKACSLYFLIFTIILFRLTSFWCLMSSCWKFHSVCNFCSLVKISSDVVNLYLNLYVNLYLSKKISQAKCGKWRSAREIVLGCKRHQCYLINVQVFKKYLELNCHHSSSYFSVSVLFCLCISANVIIVSWKWFNSMSQSPWVTKNLNYRLTNSMW